MNSTEKLPQRRSHHGSFVHNHKLYVYGGHDIQDGKQSSLWSLNVSKLNRTHNLQECIDDLVWVEIPTQGFKLRKYAI